MFSTRIFAASAALLLCACASMRANAITYSASFFAQHVETVDEAKWGRTWVFPAFSEPGTLTAVTLSATIDAHGRVSERNPFLFPIQWTPTLYFESSIFFASTWTTIGPVYYRLPQVTLQPNRGAGLERDAFLTYSATYVTPSFLGAVSRGEIDRVLFSNLVRGVQDWGAVTGSGTTTLTITYEYSVPEAGSTAALLASVLTGLCTLRHCRRKCSGPTA